MRDNEPGFQSPKFDGPWVNAVHPGGVATDQLSQAVDAYGTLGKVGVMTVKPFMKDPVDEGCRPALFAATSEDVVKEGIQGQYVSLAIRFPNFFLAFLLFSPSLPIPTSRLTFAAQPTFQIVPDRKITDPSKQAQDDELGENLWRLSEQILQEKLGSVPYKQGL